MSYNPKPPRVWSRVQHQCTFVDDSSYNTSFDILTGKTVSQAEADYQQKMFYKGNILQHKKNSSSLTKTQKYSQICKGAWVNRTKSYATQTQTYSNPNTSNLQQVNYTSVLSNETTYIPGPVHFNIPAPYGCSSNITKNGGSLLCNTIVNPCTDEIVKITNIDATLCYPNYCSDVPGKIQDLCWNSRLATWYPRQRYVMPTSGTKWPEGYKGLVSAVDPKMCEAMIVSEINNNNTNNTDTVNTDTVNTDTVNTDNILEYNNINNNNDIASNSNNDVKNLVNYHIIEKSLESINLTNYLNDNNNTVVTFDNKTANVIQLLSPDYTIINDFYFPDGTNNIELFPNQAISIYYFTYNTANNTSNSLPTLKAIIF